MQSRKIPKVLSVPLAASCLLLMVLLAGCEYLPFGFSSIKDIVENPSQYENKEVKVKGLVSDVTKLPFVEVKLYVLNEGGYQVPVFTKAAVPPAGSRVIVVGVVENVAILGGQSVGLHIRETKRVDE